MLPTHPTRALAPLLLAVTFLALPAAPADAQSSDPDGYNREIREQYLQLNELATDLARAIHGTHVTTHQLHMPDEGNPYQVGTRFQARREPPLYVDYDGPRFVLKFEVVEHDSHHIQRMKARGLEVPMDPTGEVISIQLDDETLDTLYGSRLRSLAPEAVSELRDGAVLPDEMVANPWGGWPPAAALEEARADEAVDAFRGMVDVWERLLELHEQVEAAGATSFLEGQADYYEEQSGG